MIYKIMALISALSLGLAFIPAQNAAAQSAPAANAAANTASGGAETEPAKRTLTVDEAVRLAVENNLSLQSERVTLSGKKRVSDLSWNQFLPAVGVSGSLGTGFIPTESTVEGMKAVTSMPLNNPLGLPAGMPDIYGVVPYSMDTKTSAMQISVGGQIGWSGLNIALFEGLRKLKKDYEAGAVTFDKAKIQVERDVRKAYYNLLLMQEQIELLRQSYRNAQRQEDSARANYQGGLAPELQVMQAQVQRENLRPQMEQAENGLRLQKASFAMNIGIPFEEDFALEGLSLSTEFIPLDAAELISSAKNNKPDINELKAQLLALRSARNALKYQLWTPSLTLSWGLNLGTRHTSITANDTTTNTWGDPTLSDTFSLGLSWSLNGLLPFTTQYANLHDLDDNIRKMDIGLAQAVRGAEIEVFNTISSLEQARVSAEAGRYSVQLAERSHRLTNEAYQAGLQTLLEVQNAELQLRQARINLVQQQVNFLTGVIDLEYATGVPFGTILGKH
ncbi:MAG: TolC family protein [Spirochaetaceae bacterium]|jgi:outer membrane protein TolC|nr:TolC family protein [Spirochaetaceae bacterium]